MTPPITTPMRLARIAFVLASLFALTMALLPMPPRTPIDGFGDKFAHVTAFAVMTALASLGWPRAASGRQLAGLSAFGALIEVLQAIPALQPAKRLDCRHRGDRGDPGDRAGCPRAPPLLGRIAALP